MRKPAALIPYIALVAAIAGGLIWHLGNQRPRFGRVIATGQATIGGPFSLTDQNGRIRNDKDFAGRYMLVYFGYTNCPDVCPTTLAVIAEAMKRLGRLSQKIVPIFVTVDPARDTPKVLKAYLNAFGSEFVGLTGTEPSIALIAKEYHVWYHRHKPVNGLYAVDHSNAIYLMGPDGKFIADYNETMGPKGLAKALRKQMS
jgi:protein SCO1/2